MRYLIITYILRPDGKSDESVKVEDKLTNHHKTYANIILDFKTKEVVKARMNEPIPRDWNKIYYYFVNIYPDIFATLEKENLQESK